LIHLEKFRSNLHAVRERIGPARLICVPVKADAYGHGAVRIAQAALESATGPICLAVAAVSEGAELREAGITAPALLFSQSLPAELPLILQHRLIPFVSDREFSTEAARTAAVAGVRLPVHLKIDTGMGRLGCSPEAAPRLAAFIASRPSLEYAGTATHLAAADSPAIGDAAYTREQLARFRGAVEHIRAAGLNPGIVHAANSGAVLLYPDAWFDMVRPGILLYGYNTVAGLAAPSVPVEPVMELRCNVVFLKEVKKGESVSYGRAWTAPRDTVIATLPLGYGDGLPRGISGNWTVRIRGRQYPLVGRICMDQCMADLGPQTDIPRWEEAVIFGGAAPGAAALAAQLGTIPYEITCNINRRVPRIYTGE
jgi:alanine racemase